MGRELVPPAGCVLTPGRGHCALPGWSGWTGRRHPRSMSIMHKIKIRVRSFSLVSLHVSQPVNIDEEAHTKSGVNLLVFGSETVRCENARQTADS